MSSQSVNTTIRSATSPELYPVHSGFRGWENLTSSSPSGTLLKVVAVAVISGLIGFLLGAYWERSRSAKTLKGSEDNAASPVVEPTKTEMNPSLPSEVQSTNAIASSNAQPATAPAPAEPFKIDWNKLPEGIQKAGIEKIVDEVRTSSQSEELECL